MAWGASYRHLTTREKASAVWAALRLGRVDPEAATTDTISVAGPTTTLGDSMLADAETYWYGWARNSAWAQFRPGLDGILWRIFWTGLVAQVPHRRADYALQA